MRTRVTDIFGIEHPIVSAGIPILNPELIAAVSEAGGLGILGVTMLSPDAIHERAAAIRKRTSRPFGFNLLVPFCSIAQFDACIEARVPVLSTAWGPADDGARRARAAGIPLLHMVTTAAEAVAAARAGASVIAAQGTEAGGGLVGSVGSMALVPAVIDALTAAQGDARPPVIAAGGVADGRGLAAALTLGAEGVLVGTRFMVTDEASVWPAWKAAICAATEADTIQTRITNLVARPTWAPVAPGRVLRTRAVMSWVGREEELAALSPTQREEIAAQWAQARQDGRAQDTEVIAGQDCGIIREVLPAAAVVREMITTAETILRRFADPR